MSILRLKILATDQAGLGKTVEAIALILLHRHPLAPPGPRPIPKHALRKPTSSDPLDNLPDVQVPVIDLSADIPNTGDERFQKLAMAEKMAFEGRRVWDPEAQLLVDECSVSDSPGEVSDSLTSRIPSSSPRHPS